jgi:Signal transduction histidine kinase
MGYSKQTFEDINSEDVVENYYAKEGTISKQIRNNIAHELKTPITGIRGYLETILRDENMDITQIRNFTQKAYYQTLRLSSLVNDVSILNKIEENSQNYLIENFNLFNCLKDIQEELEQKLKDNNTTITTNLKADDEFRGCYQLVYSLFKNLIDNTIEHAGKNTKIVLSVEKNTILNKNLVYNFTFTDNGCGVPEEAIGKLFERYYTANTAPKKKGSSGLGLAIVRNAVLFHNGKITVKNGENGGLTFKFNLFEIR